MSILTIPESLLSKAGVKKPKQVIYGAAAVVVAIVIFVIARKIIQKSGSEWTEASLKSMSEEDLAKLNTDDATISKGDAITISENLLNAMCGFGTDESQIMDNLSRCKTKGDLNLVIQTFGVKPYDGFGLATKWLGRQSSLMKNLNGWLRAELSGYYLKETKAIFDNLNVPF